MSQPILLPSFKGRRVAVMGLARSGLAAARVLAASGADVLAWDDGVGGQKAAEAAGIPLTNLHEADLSGVAALVLSPGIPHTFPAPHPVAARAKAAGVPIIGDVELLRLAQPDAAYVGITGTNGKSTTTALTGHILAYAGRTLAVGGNLGIPVLTFPALVAGDVYVLEMSSYQLELTPSLGFDAAVLLNITPDHLDRHGGMDGYIAAKRLIFQAGARDLSKPPAVAILGVDEPNTAAMADSLEAEGGRKVVRISSERPVPGGVHAAWGVLVDDTGGQALSVVDLRQCAALPGRHNWQNACAAYAATRAVGVAPDVIAEAMRTFPGLVHRQQTIATLDGIRFVNDSKATNADAASKALGCYEDMYWIVGGKAKEGGLSGLEPFMGRVRHAFLIGEATEAFAPWLEGKVSYGRYGTLDQAVPAAYAMAREAMKANGAGGTVLLSPACASFDQYPNFEVRGDAFVRIVRQLAGQLETGKDGTP
ncbi:UDP-N-acetylmuramoylalanine--D-glutamate ligase [Nitrospirillum amazonense]|uniref:UDP-N-acetylmuramoylalanine--D-glutamate ligase n=1 Tax=Nitrospirillum amazonense TaxID=28077 RepID=A0A560JYK7_9PROT|nr:UDP-N-acetylmuramoyl-L-alanine--D-glutamate ligase [Nitrospirillum amazonense]TWB73430.1 UDP-N-acetylmuramoylalanine--D-glutamate ligase [Nitrospirillum amazonense]